MKACLVCGTTFPTNFNQKFCSPLCQKTNAHTKKRATSRAWYEANADKAKTASKARYEANKESISVTARTYREKNREALSWAKRLYKYGITKEQYLTMYQQQNGLCAICLGPCRDSRNRSMAVDHCHVTGRIRGLLCSPCNTAIGMLQDSPVMLRRAADYLEK